jgi:hypothetical protein
VIDAAGWEHIYDYLSHILGMNGKFSGIGMHLGHYQAHTNFMQSFGQSGNVKGFFNATYWIRFITAGAALWLQSLDSSTHSPCCDLNHIGGDGTGIGVSLNEVFDLPPVWQPEDLLSSPPIEWGRLDRCVIASPMSLQKEKRAQIAQSKKFCKTLIAGDSGFRNAHRLEVKAHEHAIPTCILEELHRWLGGMDERTKEWLILQRILAACMTDESVLGIITNQIAPSLSHVLSAASPLRRRPLSPTQAKDVWKHLYTVRQHGMGDDIGALITIQLQASSDLKILGSTHGLLTFLRESLLVLACRLSMCRISTFLFCRVELVLSRACIQVERFSSVYARIASIPDEAVDPKPHPDPLRCGFKYNFTESRSQFRSRWHLPAEGAGGDVFTDIVDGVSVQYSGDGCAKVRWKRSTKSDRAGLWIWVCMRHNMIAGYHVMPKPEGLRDPVCSVYRFKKKPPKTVFMDFACGCEETALNWIPHMYKDTQFHHDAFHGTTHKCGPRFKCKRFKKFAEFDTSIMEQVIDQHLLIIDIPIAYRYLLAFR